MNCTFRVAKTKALISFAVTAKLICAFVFPHADCWFSHDAAHLFAFFVVRMLCSNLANLSHYENMPMQYIDIFSGVKFKNFF